MELLIPGLILVALMVYASTRIKRSAAEAFEPETVETDDFVIQKPEGFLHNLNAGRDVLFEAYSKDFSKESPALRLGQAIVTRPAGAIDQVVDELRRENFVEDGSEVLGERQYRHFSKEDDGEAERHVKLCEREGTVFKLEVFAARDAPKGKWLETFLDTFRVK
jgi:hypothetical protein